MRIVIDLQACQTGSRLGGIGRYSLSLTKAMIRQPRGHEFWVLLNGLYPDTVAAVRKELIDLLPPDRIRVIHFSGPVAEADEANQIRFKVATLVREHVINELRPDMVFISSLFEGLYEEAVTSLGQLSSAQRTAVVLYDLIPLVEREKYLAEEFKFKWYQSKTQFLKKAGVILSISEFSRQEGLELLNLKPDSIINMSSAIDPFFKPIDVSAEDAAHLRNKLGIKADYLMFTGSFDQRKNHELLIKGFANLPEKLRKNLQLVIVGNGWDGAYQHLRNIAVREGLQGDDLVFSGHISDIELLQIYNLAKVFVFPSLREGFGLPVLEAMSCGTPAIGSNVTSIPEVIGMDEALFDPRDYVSIRDKIAQCLTDEMFYKRLKDHSLKQAARFSWDRSAIIALDAMEAQHTRLMSKSKNSKSSTVAPLNQTIPDHSGLIESISSLKHIEAFTHDDIEDLSRAVAVNEASLESYFRIKSGKRSPLRVGWVTTWNTKCGIATYTIPVRAAMPAEHWMFAPYETNLVDPEEDCVVRSWQIGGGDDLVNLSEAVDKAKIDAVIIHCNYGFYNFEALSEFIDIQDAAGRVVFIILHSTKDPDPRILDRKLADLAPALAKCLVFVHQVDDVAALKRLGLEANVHHMPLGMHEDAPESISLPAVAKKKVIATYGFALPNKGLIELIDAFALMAAKDKKLHLLMVNAEFPVQESKNYLNQMEERLKHHGLTDRATIVSDYMSNARSIGYLRLADLIVIPYQNTTESSSGSARMSLAAGRPVAVTPLHIFDDMRSAVFTLPGISAEDMSKGMAEILEKISAGDPAIDKITQTADLWVKAHGFGAVGRYLFSTLLEQIEIKSNEAAVRAAAYA